MEKIVIKLVENKKELEDAQSVRYQVFTLEQGIDKNLDIDGKDEGSEHIIAYLGAKSVGTIRIRYPQKNGVKLERMAVLLTVRGQSIGKKILDFTLNYLTSKGVKSIYLDSQYHAKGFYEKFGFKVIGDKFTEVGIDHVKMKKEL